MSIQDDVLQISAADSTRTLTWSENLSRRLVHKQLKSLARGRLHLSDAQGEVVFGEPGDIDARLVVEEPSFYVDVLTGGGLGAAQAWIDGKWETESPTDVIRLMVRNIDVVDQLEGGMATLANLLAWGRHALNRNSRSGSARNIRAHYDLGNDLFEQFLDATMTYSSAVYTSGATSLEDAQTEKLDRLCRMVQLSADDNLIEIGTGWGSLAIHAASTYGCRVTSVTLSKEQHEAACQRITAAGLSGRIDVKICDYRDVRGEFDKLISIEMIEAVGHKNLPGYFAQCASLLKADGLMAIQAITMPDQRYERYLKTSDFIQQVVFPGSCCPSVQAMLNAICSASDLKLVQLEDIGLHYAKTLAEWHRTFLTNERQIAELGYSEAFRRMWRYYLSYCEAGFAERYTSTVQMVLAKPNANYSSVGRATIQ